MQVVTGGSSFWTYALLFASLQLWGRLSTSTSSAALPAPELRIYSRSPGSVALACRAPRGHQGVHFMLYRSEKNLDSQELQFGAKEVQFTVRVTEGGDSQPELYCCLYKDREGRYSAFSPYLQLQLYPDAAPTHSTPSFPAPVLSVQPSNGAVKRGEVLTFSCHIPTPTSQPLPQSGHNSKQVTFLLLRTPEGTGETSIVPQPHASQALNSEPRPGVYTLGPVSGDEEGKYTCIYQVSVLGGLVNSSLSNLVQVTITEVLPIPTLVLQQQTDALHLLCSGSPAYPGAAFSLYLEANQHPVDTRRVSMIQHQAVFPVPVQDTVVALYQCQYSVLLGRKWSSSERSLPLAVIRGTAAPSSPGASPVDWPLVLGSASAVVLFLSSVALIAVVIHRKVKAAAEEKKKRMDARFWTEVHGKDHIVDLPLRRTSTYQEWTGMDTNTDSVSRPPLWNSMSTFTAPMH